MTGVCVVGAYVIGANATPPGAVLAPPAPNTGPPSVVAAAAPHPVADAPAPPAPNPGAKYSDVTSSAWFFDCWIVALAPPGGSAVSSSLSRTNAIVNSTLPFPVST